MPILPDINVRALLEFLGKLLNTPSPTGLAEPAVALTEETLKAIPGLKLSRTRKGALVATWPVRQDAGGRALTAHVDTLGAMVKEIKPNGRLKLTKIGGFAWNTVEGEGLTVLASHGQTGARRAAADQGFRPRSWGAGERNEARRRQPGGPSG